MQFLAKYNAAFTAAVTALDVIVAPLIAFISLSLLLGTLTTLKDSTVFPAYCS